MNIKRIEGFQVYKDLDLRTFATKAKSEKGIGHYELLAHKMNIFSTVRLKYIL